MSRSPVGVSVARIFFRGGVASPTPNPLPFSAGLGTGLGGVKCRRCYDAKYWDKEQRIGKKEVGGKKQKSMLFLKARNCLILKKKKEKKKKKKLAPTFFS
jgi:hypothetical protein